MARAATDPHRARKPAKKAGYHHGDLRRALIESAIDVVAREDASAVSLRELAARLGVTHAAPYRHFPTKDSLLATVAAEGFKLLRDAMVTARDAAGDDDQGARLLATGLGYVRFAFANPGYFKVMFSHVGDAPDDVPDVAREGGNAFGVLLDAIVAAQRAGVVRGGDPRSHAVFAWSATHGLANLLIEHCLAPIGLPEDPEPLINQLLADLLLGLGPR